MSVDDHLERRVFLLERSVRAYRTTTTVLLVLVVVLVIVLLAVTLGRRQFARAIRIDGQIACLVKNVEAAQRVHDLLLQEGKGELPGEAAIEQQWKDEDWPVDDGEVLSIADAVEVLKGKVKVLVAAYAIEVDGTKAVYLPGKGFADDVLTALKASYVKEGDKIIGEQSFLEEVRATAAQARTTEVTTDIHGAVRLLSGAKRKEKKYTVKPRDFPEKIAAAHGMKPAELYELNPGIRGKPLQVGQVLTVALPKAAITVRTVKEATETKELPPEVQKTYSPTIPKGQTQVASPGEPGEKLVRVHLVYHNDQVARKDVVSGQIVKPPSPKRILIGTGEKPKPEPDTGSAAAGREGATATERTRPQ